MVRNAMPPDNAYEIMRLRQLRIGSSATTARINPGMRISAEWWFKNSIKLVFVHYFRKFDYETSSKILVMLTLNH